MRTLLVYRLGLLASTLIPLAGNTMAEDGAGWPSIGLALGSGGAGGLAHIAMLEIFEELEVQPDVISGTSIGAVIGALYAAGLESEEIRVLFAEFGDSALNPFSGFGGNGGGVNWTDLIDFDFNNASVFSTDGFLDFIGERIEARDFSELTIPLKIVATDYWTGEPAVFSEGDLFQAIKASIAVPGLFAPVANGERLLIDGGVSNPLPWDLLEDQDVVVAIDVTGIRSPSPDDPPDLAELLFKTFEIMQQSMIRERRSSNPPDIYIKPELEDVRLLHFERVDRIISKAEPAARELRDQLLRKRSG